MSVPPPLFLFSNKTLTATLKVILKVIPSTNRYAVTNEKCDTKKIDWQFIRLNKY